jgi:hypothetical protein
MNANARLLRLPRRSPRLWLRIVLAALAVSAASPAQKMIVWSPGMEHAYQDGVLWLKADSKDGAAIAVSVSQDAQFISVQVVITNHSPSAIDVLPDRFALTLSQPQTLPLGYVPPEGAPGAGILRATTVRPGQELRGAVLFRQDRSCTGGGDCRGLLNIQIGDTMFVFPVTFTATARTSLASTPTSAQVPPVAPARPPAPPKMPPVGPQIPAPTAPLGKGRAWKIAKVLDSATAKGFVENGAVIPVMTLRETELLLLSDQFAYIVSDTRSQVNSNMTTSVVRAIANRHHGCHYIVNDNIQFYQEKAILHVIDADGKDCKTDVLRQERLQ